MKIDNLIKKFSKMLISKWKKLLHFLKDENILSSNGYCSQKF